MKIAITGAAGLVGQNLVALLVEEGAHDLAAIDKNAANLAVLARLHPRVRTVVADLAEPGGWESEIASADVVVQLHAQIAGKTRELLVRNNVDATRRVLGVVRERGRAFVIHASSSSVNSVVHDGYSDTKREQERLVRESGVPHCVLRPTLMFGWFDPKHLGWLARFMERTPIFPVPGHGRYMRQPLYNRDFCRAIAVCIRTRPAGAVYDLTGPERIDFVDMIRVIRDAKGLRTPIVPIPFALFKALLRVYGLVSARPPFTTEQLDALAAGDDFPGVDIEATFGFRPTPFRDAIRETFGHPVYSRIALASPH
jgi:uncharacterized protein YbjT (DUF2867 family)